ncbi:MAG TPA: tRNA (guanosine(37)-N1)-methyltransferase TrmD [Thermoanaerobaculaceae bacterium]|nr:tRNA (guanosine(37)-N1)-methyltransferase TrmD [Thermoanaerobaculaceae bacterium]HPS78615.1 tRNA (guanosine(37)-N1)-methyltransferase TrmD [Thermoanaerobaculaceae bacterium]
MRCDILTIFPAPVEAYLSTGVLGRAAARGLLDLRVHDLRRWAINRYGQVDDEPYGGGPGMVLMASAVVPAVRELVAATPDPPRVLLPDPRGRAFTDRVARDLAGQMRLVFVCGRYEGFDERVHALLGADEISLGDFVLSGGELAALAILDAVSRHVPGVVGDAGSVAADSFTSGLLDFPVYTRPRSFENLNVPDVLLSGHHEAIGQWRLEQALRLTLRRRPELVVQSWEHLSAQARRLVPKLAAEDGMTWPPGAGAGDDH